MYLKRNRASSDNMRVICSSKKAKNTYEVHTQRATSVITQSFYSEFSFFSTVFFRFFSIVRGNHDEVARIVANIPQWLQHRIKSK